MYCLGNLGKKVFHGESNQLCPMLLMCQIGKKTLKDDPQRRKINEVDSDDSKESQEVL